RRIHDRADCDVDFEDIADAWREGVVAKIEAETPKEPKLAVASLHTAHGPTEAARHTRAAPFSAEVLVNQKITGRESSKDVRHVELSLEESGLRYLPGDAIGIWPENPPVLVNTL